VLSAKREGHRLLIARCRADELETVQQLEEAGFRLMDTLVYYSRGLEQIPPIGTQNVVIRSVRPSEAEDVRALARATFSGYQGHYHADPRLPQAQCDEVYSDWAYRSCVSATSDADVLVALDQSQLIAFATLRRNSPVQGEGVLFGVSPLAQGRGIYRALMEQAMNTLASIGCSEMVVSTQITNRAVQKVWARLGFEPSVAWYTLHAWP
jgi:GNAT superfamily N-acetyltransferase